MTNDLSDFAPPRAERAPGLKWDVFISCLQAHRLWATELYDVLRHLNYQVFFYGATPTTEEGILSQMQLALESSASAVVLWSDAAADSEWNQREHHVMEGLRTKGSFHYVMANLDRHTPPLFAQAQLWIDFSDSREGPRGSALLRLLWALQRLAVPNAVMVIGQEIDQRTRQDLILIEKARVMGDADALMTLARGSHPAWTFTALLGCATAHALIGLGGYSDAVSLLADLRSRFPTSLRPMQLLGLALSRSGQWENAQGVLKELYQLGARDPDTLTVYARTFSNRYRQTGSRTDLEMSQRLYAEAFERSPNDYYAGINAASASLMLGSVSDAQQYAEHVKVILGVDDRDFWSLTTRAEAELVLGRFDEAAATYRTAAARYPMHVGSLASTWTHASRLLEALGAPRSQRAQIAAALGHTVT